VSETVRVSCCAAALRVVRLSVPQATPQTASFYLIYRPFVFCSFFRAQPAFVFQSLFCVVSPLSGLSRLLCEVAVFSSARNRLCLLFFRTISSIASKANLVVPLFFFSPQPVRVWPVSEQFSFRIVSLPPVALFFFFATSVQNCLFLDRAHHGYNFLPSPTSLLSVTHQRVKTNTRDFIGLPYLSFPPRCQLLREKSTSSLFFNRQLCPQLLFAVFVFATCVMSDQFFVSLPKLSQ